MGQKILLVKSQDGSGLDLHKDGKPSFCHFTQPIIMEAPGATQFSPKTTIIRRLPCNSQCDSFHLNGQFITLNCGGCKSDYKISE
jgi:hypothetical protein